MRTPRRWLELCLPARRVCMVVAGGPWAQVPPHQAAADPQGGAAGQAARRAEEAPHGADLEHAAAPDGQGSAQGLLHSLRRRRAEGIGEASGAFKPVVSDDLAVFAPENLRQFDAIVLNNTSGPWITPDAPPTWRRTAEGARCRRRRRSRRCCARAFWTIVQNGGGVVCLHFAIAANRALAGVQASCSARSSRDIRGPRRSASRSRNRSIRWWRPSAARTSASPTRSTSTDRPTTARQLRVLMSLDPARTNMGVQWINRKDNDFALTWVKPYGKGRIFNTSFGHMANLYCESADAPVLSRRDPVRRPAIWRHPRRRREPSGAAACPALSPPRAGARVRLSLRRHRPRRLGRRPHDLVRPRRRDHRPDHGGHETQGKQLPDLEGRGARTSSCG